MLRLLVVLVAVSLAGCSDFRKDGLSRPPEGLANLVGRPVPDFSIEDVAGGMIQSSELRGKVALIDFWHLGCPPCLASAPILQRMHHDYAEQGLVVLGVNVRDGADRIRKYAADHSYTYRLACQAGDFKRACGLQMLPTFLLVDRAGIVRQVFVGDDDLESKLTDVISRLLKE